MLQNFIYSHTRFQTLFYESGTLVPETITFKQFRPLSQTISCR